MALANILTPIKVVTIPGDALVVQLTRLPGDQNIVKLHITRDGVREERFTIDELRHVLNDVGSLLAKAQARQLNVTPAPQPAPK